MTLAQATKAAQQAGFTGVHLVEAVAIAQAESGGEIGSTNYNTNGSVDHGLWQINSAAWPNYDPNRLLTDPLYNAQAAFAISKGGTNWSPWSSYKNGSAQAAAPTAEASVTSLINGGDGTVAKTLGAPSGYSAHNASWSDIRKWITDPFGQAAGAAGDAAGTVGSGIVGSIPGAAFVGQFFANLTSGKFWARIGEGLGAILLIGIGLALVFRRDLVQSGKDAIGAAKVAAA